MTITGIHLITGLIGSGKTLRAVWHIDREVKAGRAVYACNINGLNIPGVIPFENPRDWRDLPPGALLVVDEAQRFWRARRGGDVPPELQDMETSRHDSVSMLLLTQQPTYLDKHLRGLVTCHEHLYRRLNAQATQVFRWNRCVEDPHSPSDKDGADQELFVYPKHLYGAYKSAEVHTAKFTLGAKPKLIIAALAVSLGLFAWTFSRFMGDDKPEEKTVASAGAAGAEATPAPAAAPEPMETLEQYIGKLRPRINTAPWTAPVFDSRKAVAEPRIFCMASGAGLDANGKHSAGSVTCLTEQGTPYALDDKSARMLARNGEVYNPFRREAKAVARSGGDGGKPPSAMSATADAPLPGAMISADQVSGYGGFGASSSDSAP